MKSKGSLVNVGLGMTLGSHISPLSRNFIEKADVVFVGASNQLVEEWVKTMNKDVRSLQPFYNEGTSRMITYKKMVDAIMTEVRAGKAVCGAFYGHPGVFAWAPHETIRECHKEGFKAHMEPGISAEDCLYADLGLDPGTRGCIHYEASQFMFRNKIIDPTSYLVLWQVGVAGDKSMAQFTVGSEYKQILVDLLLETHPEDHEIILYECAVLPIERARIETIKLKDLPYVENITLKTTVVIPPSKKTTDNKEILAKIAQLQESQ